MNDNTDYMPHEKEQAFELKRKDDPNQLTAIKERERACDDPHLTDGDVRLFVRLLDMALNPFYHNGRRGRIVTSQVFLGGLIHCDERSIRRRVDALIRAGYIWTNLVPRPNTKPILAYHVTAFIPRQQVAQEMAQDGLWGGRKRRHDHGFTRTGSEAGRQRRMGSGFFDQFGRQISFNYLENAAASGQESGPSAVKIDRSERTPVSSASGQNCPVTEDVNVRSQRSELSGVTGQNCPLSEDGSVRQIESPVVVSVPGRVKGDAPPPEDAFAKSLKGLFPSRLSRMRSDLELKAHKARNPDAKREYQRRVKLVEDELLGGPVPDEPVAPRAARKAPAPEKPMTEAEVLQSARNAIQLGATMLTDGQRNALLKAGELPKQLWKAVGK